MTTICLYFRESLRRLCLDTTVVCLYLGEWLGLACISGINCGLYVGETKACLYLGVWLIFISGNDFGQCEARYGNNNFRYMFNPPNTTRSTKHWPLTHTQRGRTKTYHYHSIFPRTFHCCTKPLVGLLFSLYVDIFVPPQPVAWKTKIKGRVGFVSDLRQIIPPVFIILPHPNPILLVLSWTLPEDFLHQFFVSVPSQYCSLLWNCSVAIWEPQSSPQWQIVFDYRYETPPSALSCKLHLKFRLKCASVLSLTAPPEMLD